MKKVGDDKPKRKPTTAEQREMYVVKANELIRNGRYELTLQQQKIVLYCISKIKPFDEWHTYYDFSVKDFCEVCGSAEDLTHEYDRIKADMLKLTERKWLTLPNGDEMTVSWLGDAKIRKKNGIIRFCFNPNTAEYLFRLRDEYTQYRLIQALALKSTASIKLFELLKSYADKRVLERGQAVFKTFTIEELKDKLNIEKYKEFKDFNKYIIKPAVEEINENCEDMRVQVHYEREGRSVKFITFELDMPTYYNQAMRRHMARYNTLPHD